MIYQEIPRKMFQMRTQSQMAVQDVGLKVSLHDLSVSARIAVFWDVFQSLAKDGDLRKSS